ncbi:hypothetical protein ACR77J_08185 [Tissierella praeacuta]|uniref:hypothetical protein n=1 Tax=Tissierella praeacuta TaxID=43131 RepID=UPI003DA43E40
MLTTPILNDIKTFDATIEHAITFNVIGGNQVVGNNLTIEKISDNTVVYNQSQETFNFKHVLPVNTLVNGVNYRAKIRTKDINGNWSSYSSSVLFWCYSKPSLYINTIDYDNQNKVYNQTVLFETIYSQSEGEILQSYRYLLYNENKDLLRSFPEQYADGTQPLTQEIAGLENNILKYLEVITISPNGNLGTTGLIPFKPFYVAPKLTVILTPENLPQQGAIKVSANIVQIILKLYDNNGNQINPTDVEYINDDLIDMNRIDYDKLIADEGFNILQSNFLLQLWCKDLPEDKTFLILHSPEGKIEMFKSKNKIRVYKYVDNLDIKGYFASNEFEINQGQDLMIYMKQDNHLIDLQVEPL